MEVGVKFLAKYFLEHEFRCPCCNGLPDDGMDPFLLSLLDVLRHKIGEPLIVSSGYRCFQHNQEVGGVVSSQHVKGTAADILVPNGVSLNYMADMARGLGADGIGRYYSDGFIHIDTRGYLADW